MTDFVGTTTSYNNNNGTAGVNDSVNSSREDAVPSANASHNNNDDDEEEDLFAAGDDGDEKDAREPSKESSPESKITGREPSDSPPSQTLIQSSSSPSAEYKKEPSIPFKSTNNRTPIAPPVLFHNPPNVDPASFGLPAGVKIPKSITASLLKQGKLLETLKSLPINLINDALVEYDDAVEIKGEAIRNHGAYLYGVVKRYVSVHDRANSGEGSGILPMGETLTPAVHHRLEQLVTSNFCSREEMNDKVRSKIRMLSERDALFALDELSSVERSSIRNFGSYFMGILNRYMRGDMSSKIRDPNAAVAVTTPATTHQQQHQQQQQRGRDRSYRDTASQYKSSSFQQQRDRSRDRFEENAYPNNNNNNFQNRRPNRHTPNGNYDTRQQQPYQPQQQQQQRSWQQQQQAPPPPPMFAGGGPRPMMQHNNPQQHQQPSPYMQHQQQQQPGMFPPQQQHQLPHNQQQPPHLMQQTMNPGMPQPGGMPLGGGMQPQPMGQTLMGGMMQQQQPMPYMGQQQSPYMQQAQQQQPMMNAQQQQPGMTVSYAAAGMGWQPSQPPQMQSQQPIPVDILGLADKAASAVQALANQQSKMQALQASAPSYPPMAPQHQQQQPHNYALNNQAPPPMMTYTVTTTQQPMLAPQQQQQQQQPPPMAPHMGMQAPSAYDMNSSQQPSQPARSGRRTTASISQLPIAVQFAVQNLQATGAVEGPLDDGILGMIHDLPERMALTAIQRFASIDKSTMRSKTAYLAGMLRRELEGIRKR